MPPQSGPALSFAVFPGSARNAQQQMPQLTLPHYHGMWGLIDSLCSLLKGTTIFPLLLAKCVIALFFISFPCAPVRFFFFNWRRTGHLSHSLSRDSVQHLWNTGGARSGPKSRVCVCVHKCALTSNGNIKR